jgi:transposase InsO family protein
VPSGVELRPALESVPDHGRAGLDEGGWRTLHWLKPGTAWAIDHCTPPAPVEGTFSQILSVRDLAAQAQLAWTPVPDGSALHVRFVLETLIAEHGAPLLLKKDNGSALNDAGVNRLLAQNGIIGLLSPPATPSYNGGCEAGNGSLRTRTSYEAARHGRAGRWTCDDCEAARLQAFRTARPWGAGTDNNFRLFGNWLSVPAGKGATQAWSKREPITAELRQQFQNAVAFYQEHERKKKAFLPGIELEPGVRASINRAAVRRALQACRLLDVRRGELSLPITS